MRHFSSMKQRIGVLMLGAALVGGGIAAGQTRDWTIVPPDDQARRLFIGISPTLGVSVRDLTAAEAKAAHLPGPAGAYVQGVSEDSAATKAGIRQGDVIVEFDGEAVRSAAQLSRLIGETPPDRAVKVAVMREGKRVELTATLERRQGQDLTWPWQNLEVRPPILRWQEPDQQLPREFPRSPSTPFFSPPLWRYNGSAQLGVTVQELTPQLREYFGVRQGVLVATVSSGSAAARAGVKAGDVITSIDAAAVRSADDLRQLLEDRKVGDEITLHVVRDRKPLAIKVTLEAARARIVPI
jgi:serine protease Do